MKNLICLGACLLLLNFIMILSANDTSQQLPQSVTGFGLATDPNPADANYHEGDADTQRYFDTLRHRRLTLNERMATARELLHRLVPVDIKQSTIVYIDTAEIEPKSADYELGRMQFFLGYQYETGHGAELNYREAMRWYQMAADNGFHQASLRLNSLTTEGK